MEARSYVENIANRTTVRGAIESMTKVAFVVVTLAGLGLIVGTGFHPAGVILGIVLLVLAGVLVRDVVLVGRQRRESPLDLAFDPAPDRGLLSPGTVFGLAGGIALFSLVLTIVAVTGGNDASLVFGVAGLALGIAVAVFGLPTLGLERRKWEVLADALRRHPELVGYLQDARARFPAKAPFPFSAPTDVVSIP